MTVTISIVIVSYRSRHVLPFCLDSISKATNGISCELIVVDNNSSDGTVDFIRAFYEDVILLANSDNLGFGKAVNQGVNVARGQYVLIVNPDILLPECSLEALLSAYRGLDNVGFLSCTLIDGRGNRLPESTRNLPTIANAMFKFLGLGNYLVRAYYYEIKNQDDIEEVPVLPGALLFVHKSVFEQISGFDERFFMYGEDVDVCHKSLIKGYKNYSLTGLNVIHLKGESSDKLSLKQRFHFYNSMYLYVLKWYSLGSLSKVFIKTISIFMLAINFVLDFIKSIKWLLIDLSVFFANIFLFSYLWSYIYYHDTSYFPLDIVMLIGGFLSIVYILILWISSIYIDEKLSLYKWLRSSILVLIGIMAFYSLATESYRFSRVVVLSSSVFSLLSSGLFRYFFFSRRRQSYYMDSINDALLYGFQGEDNVEDFTSELALDDRAKLLKESILVFDTSVFSYSSIVNFLFFNRNDCLIAISNNYINSTLVLSSVNDRGYLVDYNNINVQVVRGLLLSKRLVEATFLSFLLPVGLLCYVVNRKALYNILDVLSGRTFLVESRISEYHRSILGIHFPFIVTKDELSQYESDEVSIDDYSWIGELQVILCNIRIVMHNLFKK